MMPLLTTGRGFFRITLLRAVNPKCSPISTSKGRLTDRMGTGVAYSMNGYLRFYQPSCFSDSPIREGIFSKELQRKTKPARLWWESSSKGRLQNHSHLSKINLSKLPSTIPYQLPRVYTPSLSFYANTLSHQLSG